jgi:hypothetical protein
MVYSFQGRLRQVSFVAFHSKSFHVEKGRAHLRGFNSFDGKIVGDGLV